MDEKLHEPQGKLLGLSFMVLGLLYHGLKDIIRDDLVIVHDDIIEFLDAVVKVTFVLDNKVFYFVFACLALIPVNSVEILFCSSDLPLLVP